MKTIVEKLIRQAVEDVMTCADDCVERGKTFSDLVSDTRTSLNALGCRILETIFSAVEASFDEARDKHAVIIRNRNKTRNLLTEFGTVTLHHTLYYDKASSSYFFAADELLRIEKYSRIEDNLQAKLVSDATITSFGKASLLANDAVSRQTVHNLVKRLTTIDAPTQGTQGSAKDIYVEADEDHIHLNDGSAAEMKLVYVHEGRDNTKGRPTLINPRYFVSIDKDTRKLWRTVSKYILTNYSAYRANVHLSGDGANWIKAGIGMMPHVQYHLDKFHLQKALTNIASGRGAKQARLSRAVYGNPMMEFQKLANEILNSTANRSRQRGIAKSVMYVRSNLQYVSKENRCSAEGHVSHVLSARLSSRPMAWSRDGAERMAKLRAYMYNNGSFLQLVTSQRRRDMDYIERNVAIVGRSTEELACASSSGGRSYSTCASEKSSATATPAMVYSIPGIEKVSGNLHQMLKNIFS